MDREQEEMQFLGVFDIYKESYKIILSCRKIFTQITLTLILPFSFIFLLHIEVSNALFAKILFNSQQKMLTPLDSPQYHKLSNMLSSEWTTFWLFKVVYFTFLLIFSLLSTSAVVYTIANIYTARDVTFRNVMSVVPKVWKRLMVTFLCTSVAFFVYSFMVVFVFTVSVVTWVLMFGLPSNGIFISILVIIGVLYLAGFVYLTAIWQLASVVSVLEDTYGFKAMVKSQKLLKGKMVLAILVIFKLSVLSYLVLLLFTKVVVQGSMISSLDRTAYGMLCFLLLSLLILFGLVLQSVLYFVCKSYHHENIDKSALSDHLEIYQGVYQPLKAKEVYLEQYL